MTLWFHNKSRMFLLLFSLGFLVSAFGSIIGYTVNDGLALATFISISAHCLWISAILKAQKRKIELWVSAPALMMIAAYLIPSLRGDEIANFIAFHTGNILGFCLQAIAILSTPGYRSATRKFLALALVGYAVGLMTVHFVSYFIITSGSAYEAIGSVVGNGSTVLGLTIILMSAAKMVIEDSERALTQLALTDHLTGIYNRRALDKLFKDGQLKASDAVQFMAITMFDIDHFKKINDKYGHAFGDFVLKSFVRLVEKHIGPNHDFIRMGGEEFALVSKVSALFEASQLAERIRVEFGNMLLEWEGKSLRATVSAGIAAQPIYRADLYALLSMADRGLYSAKKSGRDRCVIHDEMTNVVIPSEERDPSEEIEIYTDKQVAVLNRISAIAEAHRSAP